MEKEGPKIKRSMLYKVNDHCYSSHGPYLYNSYKFPFRWQKTCLINLNLL